MSETHTTTGLKALFSALERAQPHISPQEAVLLVCAMVVLEAFEVSGYLPDELRWRMWNEMHPHAAPKYIFRHIDDLEPPHLGLRALLDAVRVHLAPLRRQGVAARVVGMDMSPLIGDAGSAGLDTLLGQWSALDLGPHYDFASQIAELLVGLARIRESEHVWDPNCVSGAILLAAHKAQRGVGALAGSAPQVDTLLFGAACLLLQGVELADLHFELTRDVATVRPLAGFNVDVAVLSPRIGRLPSELRGDQQNLVKSWESLDLRTCLECLREGGRAVVVVPNSWLYVHRSAQMRQWLLENHNLHAIVLLPTGALGRVTQARFSILVLEKGSKTSETRFIDHDALGVARTPRQAIDDVVNWVHFATPGDLPTSTYEDLRGSGYILLPPSEDMLQLEQIQARLEAHQEISLIALGDLAEVRPGRLGRKASGVHATPVASALDITQGQLLAPNKTVWLEEPEEEHILELGDLVLSSIGRIGWVGRVTEESAGAVWPTNLFRIRVSPTSNVLPEFLAHYFEVPLVHRCLLYIAREAHTSLSRLDRRALLTLHIPVPSLATQERVLAALDMRQGERDLLTELQQYVEAETFPLILFFQMSEQALAVREQRNFLVHRAITPEAAPLQKTLRAYGRALDRVLGEPGGSATAEFPAWAEDLRVCALSLQGLCTAPVGSGRAALQDVNRTAVCGLLADLVERVPEALGSWSLDIRDHFRELDLLLENLREQKRHETIISVAQVFLYSSDVECELGLEVHHTGSLPILDFHLRVLGEDMSMLASLEQELLEGGERTLLGVTLPGSLLEDDEELRLLLRCEWEGRFANLTPWGDELTLEVALVESLELEGKATDLGQSPYISGNPVDVSRQDIFFGRDEQLRQIRMHLESQNSANVVLLEGNRRAGKTSILKHLQREDVLPNHLAVYVSFQGMSGHPTLPGVPTDEIFASIATSLIIETISGGYTLPIPGLPEGFDEKPPKWRQAFARMSLPNLIHHWLGSFKPLEGLEMVARMVLDGVTPRQVVLMLDEFDKLQEGIDSGVTSPQVPENIRFLFQNNIGLAGVLTGSRRIRRLREEYWSALFGFGRPIAVTALARGDAARLVEDPVAGRLAFFPQATKRILDACACQPYLIQLVCESLFVAAHGEGWRQVTVPRVQKALLGLVRDSDHFRTLWGYAGSARARYVLWLVHRHQGAREEVTSEFLDQKLQAERIPQLPGDGVTEDLEHLLELELVAQESHGSAPTWRLTTDLMNMWIAQHESDASKLVQRAREYVPKGDEQ